MTTVTTTTENISTPSHDIHERAKAEGPPAYTQTLNREINRLIRFAKDNHNYSQYWEKGVRDAFHICTQEAQQREIPAISGAYTYKLGHYGLLTEDSDFFTQDIDHEQHSGKIQIHGDGATQIAQQIINALREQKRESGWLPIQTAPRDGSRVLVKFKEDLLPFDGIGDMSICRWQGLPFVARNNGDFMMWRFAAPVGQGGFPDEWLEGWKPINSIEVQQS